MNVNLDSSKKTNLVTSSTKNKSHDLTIIIPTFNRFESLLRTVSSLEYIKEIDRIVVLIIDNASNDLDVNILKKLLNSITIDYFIYVNEENYGSGYSFNISVQLANTKLIMYLFDDDQLRPEINSAIEKSKNHPNGIYVFNKFNLTNKNNHSFKSVVSAWIRNILNAAACKKHILEYNSLLLTVPSFIGAIYNREAFISLGGFDLQTGPTGDYEFTIRYWEKYGLVRYKYRVIDYIHGDNDSSNPDTYNLFPKDNYDYRLKLLSRLDLPEKKKTKLHKLIIERKAYEEKNISVFLKAKHLLITVGNYLNLI